MSLELKKVATKMIAKFFHGGKLNVVQAMSCALLCVDEIIWAVESPESRSYWNDVKYEMENVKWGDYFEKHLKDDQIA